MAVAVVVVPGFKGTRLVDRSNGRLVWAGLRQVAGLGRASTAIARPELAIENPRELVAAGALEGVRVVRGILERDYYASWLLRLRERVEPGARVEAFGYDWRQPLVESVRRFHERLEQLHASGATRFWVTAHSMGGLVVAWYLRYGLQEPESARETWYGAKRIERVVFAGVPFRGAAQMFHDLQHGSRTGFNRTLLSRDALASFPSCYQLLPFPSDAFVHGTSGEPAGVSVHEARRWRDERWGFFRGSVAPPVAARRLQFLRRQLGNAVSFASRLHAPAARGFEGQCAVLNVVGTGRRARARAFRRPDQAPEGFRTITLERELRADPSFRGLSLLEPGDGSVTVRSAQLPEPFAQALGTSTSDTRADHEALYADRATQEQMLAFLAGGAGAG